MNITNELQAKIVDDIKYKLLSHFEIDNYSVVISWFKSEELYKCFYKDNQHNIATKLENSNLDNIIQELREVE